MLLIAAGVKGLNLSAKICPYCPAFTRSAFVLEYVAQFETENIVILLLFMFALAGSYKLSVGDRGKMEWSQSIEWLF